MEDEQIVNLYWERSESAIKETDTKYGRFCHYIAFQILNRDWDAEEVVNDTWLKTWNTIPKNRPASLKSYVGMICRQLAFNTYKRNQRYPEGQFALVLDELEECVSGGDEITTMTENADLVVALNDFLRALPAKTRIIFLRPECSDAVSLEEHVLSTAKADTLSTQLTGLLGICGSVSIGTNLQGAELVSPAHDGTEVAGDFSIHSGSEILLGKGLGATLRRKRGDSLLQIVVKRLDKKCHIPLRLDLESLDSTLLHLRC